MVYDVANSVLRTSHAVVREDAEAVQAAPVCDAPAPEAPKASITLIPRVTCPNCRVAENLLAKAGLAHDKKIAEENLDLCREYGVKGAPTLMVSDGESVQLYYNVPEIKKYLATL